MSEQQQAADLVIILITGPENPKRLPSAFFLASTAAAADMNVVMYFTGPATLLLKKGVAESIRPMEEGNTIKDFMELALDNGVQFVGCLQSLELNGMTKEDLAFDVPLLTPSQALPSLGQAGRVLTW
ncbi:DsrE family protein [Aquifex aeolicus]|uniref:DsrE family protein n=1 Tax=Aquifex aeolicus TaxID=63363 RepID=UPI0002DCD673|nr:DsrE family protein [Aquifex aeolicus]